jgi:hypothetical protein
LVVSTHQDDKRLEAVWTNARALATALAEAEYDLVLVPSFSNWELKTRLEHRYQISRGLRFLEMLVNAGVPTMPNVIWTLKRDLFELSRVLLEWPGQRAFSVDLQTMQTDEKWRLGMDGLRFLTSLIGVSWEVFVIGVGHSSRIKELVTLFGHIHLINARAFELAMSGRVAIGPFLTDELVTDISKDESFMSNVLSWSAAVGPAALCSLTPNLRSSTRRSSKPILPTLHLSPTLTHANLTPNT